MTTFAGTQETFIESIKNLIELEYDTKEAYEEAIKRLENHNNKVKLREFCQDHEQHIRALSKLLQNHNEVAPIESKGIKNWISKGKVIIADIIGDRSILMAMASNESDTNKAYERMNARHDRWEDSKEFLKAALADEKKHKEWLEKNH